MARDEESSIQEGIEALVVDMAVDIDERARDKLRKRMSAIGQAHARRAIRTIVTEGAGDEGRGRASPPQRQGTRGRSQGQRQDSRRRRPDQ
ncbi:hypothetical protein N9L68_01880 [bacterium]|nr:hypothetical protein [bacterium]